MNSVAARRELSGPAGMLPETGAAPIHVSAAPWRRVWHGLKHDRAGLAALTVVAAYFAVATGVWLGWWGQAWAETGGPMWAPVSPEHWFGTNIIGQDVFTRAVAGTATAFEIGLTVAVLSTGLGALLGGVAGLKAGGWLDEIILWLAGVIDSIPFYLFVAAVAFALAGQPYAMHIAMVVCFWTLTARLVRGEVMRLKRQPFVEAARAIGAHDVDILRRHLLPNTTGLLLVQATLAFIAAIKAEIVLSFISLGVKEGVSWGVMIAESVQALPAGEFNNFLAASLMLMGLVLAFNLFADSLQDALDPKHRHA